MELSACADVTNKYSSQLKRQEQEFEEVQAVLEGRIATYEKEVKEAQRQLEEQTGSALALETINGFFREHVSWLQAEVERDDADLHTVEKAAFGISYRSTA